MPGPETREVVGGRGGMGWGGVGEDSHEFNYKFLLYNKIDFPLFERQIP